jgi:ribosomal protein S18 acetylase RimI-like enzyme
MIECWMKSKLSIKINGRESRTSIEKEMQNVCVRFIGGFAGERLVGLVIGNYDGRRGWINRLAVLPEFRKSGIASALISEAERFLKSKGARVIAALIDRSNTPSRGVFERRGYKYEEDILYYAKRESPNT